MDATVTETRRIPARDLAEGTLIDLTEAFARFSPGHEPIWLHYEYATVESVETQSATLVVVNHTNGAFGLPPDFEVVVAP